MDRRPAPRIETERTVVRRWRPTDVEAFHAAIVASTEHLRRWMPWIAREPASLEDRLVLFRLWDQAWDAGEDFPLGVFAPDDTTVVGGTGWHPRVGPDALEIGYWIAVDHVGRGLATEISGALTLGAFALEGIASVVIRHDRANVASASVPRKLGYTKEREELDEISAPGQEGVTCWWRVTRDAWAAQGASSTRPNASRFSM